MKRFWPQSLAGQLVAVLLLALVAAQVASLLILHDDRRLAFIFVAQQEVMSRTASVVRLLNKTEPALHETIVDAASSRRLRFQLADKSAVGDDDEDEGFNRFLQRRLAWELSDEVAEVRVAVLENEDEDAEDEDGEEDDEEEDDDEDEDEDEEAEEDRRAGGNFIWMPREERRFREWRSDRHRTMRWGRHRRGFNPGMTISIATKGSAGDQVWLNVYSLVPSRGPSIAIPSLITLAITAVVLVLIVILMARRLTRPLAELSRSAERFGRGEDVDLLPETGPRDIRQASRAFNDMQARLTRFVRDRTLMLAAITHDLRTPITALRIRAEMIEDDENREKILQTLAEMQSLTDAALDFARQEASSEKTRTVDLVALVESLCADMADLGQQVDFSAGDPARLPFTCHPDALKRVFRNLIENAVRYGEAAHVAVSLEQTEVCVSVEDDGPGIPAEERARIFDPFVRLEPSRSTETGGIGLGLAIARTIVHAHGGDITVSDGEGGGARFSVCLPLQN